MRKAQVQSGGSDDCGVQVMILARCQKIQQHKKNKLLQIFMGFSINKASVEQLLIIGASLSEPHIDWHNGPRGGECIYLSRGSVCRFQCSR